MLTQQVKLWEAQHAERIVESTEMFQIPNEFAVICVKYLPYHSKVIEVGVANGRDARFFARRKESVVVAVDFSGNALSQLARASRVDGTKNLVIPVLSSVQNLPIFKLGSFDAIYARSALHISDGGLRDFILKSFLMLRDGGYLMVQGKTSLDYKISRSEEIFNNLLLDFDGHLRRVWSDKLITANYKTLPTNPTD